MRAARRRCLRERPISSAGCGLRKVAGRVITNFRCVLTPLSTTRAPLLLSYGHFLSVQRAVMSTCCRPSSCSPLAASLTRHGPSHPASPRRTTRASHRVSPRRRALPTRRVPSPCARRASDPHPSHPCGAPSKVDGHGGRCGAMDTDRWLCGLRTPLRPLFYLLLLRDAVAQRAASFKCDRNYEHDQRSHRQPGVHGGLHGHASCSGVDLAAVHQGGRPLLARQSSRRSWSVAAPRGRVLADARRAHSKE